MVSILYICFLTFFLFSGRLGKHCPKSMRNKPSVNFQEPELRLFSVSLFSLADFSSPPFSVVCRDGFHFHSKLLYSPFSFTERKCTTSSSSHMEKFAAPKVLKRPTTPGKWNKIKRSARPLFSSWTVPVESDFKKDEKKKRSLAGRKFKIE